MGRAEAPQAGAEGPGSTIVSVTEVQSLEDERAFLDSPKVRVLGLAVLWPQPYLLLKSWDLANLATLL